MTSPTFQFDGAPINQTLVSDLAGGSFIAQQRNVVLVGETGTGKTNRHKLHSIRRPYRKPYNAEWPELPGERGAEMEVRQSETGGELGLEVMEILSARCRADG